jgi:tetraacyldisaccharide-1-P 4'-kinase
MSIAFFCTAPFPDLVMTCSLNFQINRLQLSALKKLFKLILVDDGLQISVLEKLFKWILVDAKEAKRYALKCPGGYKWERAKQFFSVATAATSRRNG